MPALQRNVLRAVIRTALINPNTFLLLLIAAAVSVCSAQSKSVDSAPREPDLEAILSLSWQQFDQTPNSGWRVYVNATRQQRLEAAKLIEAYLARHVDLPERQRVLCHFHAAMHYVFYASEHGGDPLVALPHLDQAIFHGKGPAHSADWNDMVIATKAFLMGDRATLLAVKERVAALPVGSAEWPNYADDLLKNLGKPYGSWQWTETPKK